MVDIQKYKSDLSKIDFKSDWNKFSDEDVKARVLAESKLWELKKQLDKLNSKGGNKSEESEVEEKEIVTGYQSIWIPCIQQ